MIKRTLLCLTLLAATASLSAQTQQITTSTDGGRSNSGFAIGPRYSNYSTDVDLFPTSFSSGRQHAFGLAGDYRSGNGFNLDFFYDHDPENGIDVTDILPIELGHFSRNRGEVALGWSLAPQIDIQGGVRLDSISVGGRALGTSVFDGVDVDHQALLGGIKLHTANDPRNVGAYILARGYLGTADFNNAFGYPDQEDSSGYRGEIGVSIPLGETNWHVVPAFEIERIDTKNDTLRLDTNRVIVNFMYTMR